MSVIRDQEKLNSVQLETLKRRNEREIKKIEGMHQTYKAELKNSHEGEVVNLRDENTRHLEMENEKKEKVIGAMKENLNKTKEMTEKQLKELQVQNTKIKTAEEQKLSADREVKVAEHELYIADINERFNDASAKVHQDGKSRIDERTATLREEYATKDELGKTKLQQQTEQFTTRFKNEGDSYEKMKYDQDQKFKKDHILANQKNQYAMAKMTEQHADFTEKRDVEARKDIRNQDIAFEKKYAEHLKIHNENLSRLTTQNETVVKTMKDGVTEQLLNTVKRSDDPFFRFTKLSPTITQHPDHVEVKIEIPEHSKQDVQFTTNSKEVVVNFNRRYDDTHSPEKGVVNKLHKVETYTTRLTTDHILDAKSVKSSYQDGVMTYIIKRA